jgi:hypothetical protein
MPRFTSGASFKDATDLATRRAVKREGADCEEGFG